MLVLVKSSVRSESYHRHCVSALAGPCLLPIDQGKEGNALFNNTINTFLFTVICHQT